MRVLGRLLNCDQVNIVYRRQRAAWMMIKDSDLENIISENNESRLNISDCSFYIYKYKKGGNAYDHFRK